MLPPLQLEAGEALATAVGLALLRGAGLDTEHADSTTTKLQAMLPAALRTTVAEISSAVSVSEGNVPEVDISAVISLASAIKAQTIATFHYRKSRPAYDDIVGGPVDHGDAASAGARAGGRTLEANDSAAETSDPATDSALGTARRVEPIRLVVLGSHWYLYAWDQDRSDHRVFRLDRMSDVHATTLTFPSRDHPDAEAVVRAAVTTSAYPRTALLRAEASIAQAKEWFPTRAATITEAADGVHITFGFDDLRWVAATLAFIPTDLEIIEPPELVAMMRGLVERTNRIVEASDPDQSTLPELPDGLPATRCQVAGGPSGSNGGGVRPE
jgi:predicted DNA-binding transcriptional regulator YafY